VIRRRSRRRGPITGSPISSGANPDAIVTNRADLAMDVLAEEAARA
jgi:hypothetical protein